MRFSRCNNPVIASLGILLAWSIDVEISQASVQFAGPTANGLATGVGSSHITEPPTARRTHARISVSEFDRHITSAATQYGVSHDLIRAVIEAESAFNPSALSDRGACGLMQLMPGTASRFGVVDCFDARENIHGGTRYLKLLLARFDGSIPCPWPPTTPARAPSLAMAVYRLIGRPGPMFARWRSCSPSSRPPGAESHPVRWAT